MDIIISASYSEISKQLRREKEVIGWKEASLYKNKYTCIISNKKSNLEVHHIKSFNSILNETINELFNKNLLDEKWFMSPYVTQEIRRLFLIKHREYGLGVVLHRKIHNEFHRLYGHENNKEQFEEFKENITEDTIDKLLTAPDKGDMVCSKCNKVVELLIDDLCIDCDYIDL
ncbi:hypothetical protein [Virgibacillus sp. SK37]|uniref:hypothetical protein n=1 Tax=Virgibacillus sp. SK37 TaxID=403957 RepID=UPI0011A1DF8F|nr:hypothetical protein [Virgibacillus sp. SK37]